MIDLFDMAEARRRKEEGMRLASDAEGKGWESYARQFLQDYCEKHPTVFSDDVWNAGLIKPTHFNAVGAIWKHAMREGWIEEIHHEGMVCCKMSQIKTTRQRLIRVYRSLIYKGSQ